MPEIPNSPSYDERLKQLRREKLKSLLHDVEVSRAIEADQPRALYRLLLKKRRTAGLADRPLIEELLANRRLFSEPVAKAPTMHTINGIGTSLYGKAEKDEADGTHIATLFLVLVFVPVLPLASYVVLPANTGGWYFLRKVPFNPKMRLWRKLFAAGIAAAGCLIAGLIYQSQNYATLHVVNALDVPVQVQLDRAAPLKVGPGGVAEMSSVHRGRHHVATRTLAGQPVEELDVTMPVGQDVVAYNVLGAAPLFARGLIYYADGKAPATAANEQQELIVYCGERFIVRDHVRWVFRENDKRLDMKSDREVLWRFALDTGGWNKTVRYLASQDRLPAAAELAASVARLEPANETAVATGIAYVEAVRSNAAALAFARELTALAPESLPAHRCLQNQLLQAGRRGEARDQYRQLHAAHPDSPAYGYLHARVELPAAAVTLYPALIERAPRDVEITAIGRPQLDLGLRDAVLAGLRHTRCDAIINAAAYTAVDKAESEPDVALRVNGEGAGHVAEAADELLARDGTPSA